MSKNTMENAVVNGFDLNQYITDEDCEFPVKESSKRSRTQRKKAAKKNKFPVGLRKEIRYERHLDKAFIKESYDKAFRRSERRILNLVISDMIHEKEANLFYACHYTDDDHLGDCFSRFLRRTYVS